MSNSHRLMMNAHHDSARHLVSPPNMEVGLYSKLLHALTAPGLVLPLVGEAAHDGSVV